MRCYDIEVLQYYDIETAGYSSKTNTPVSDCLNNNVGQFLNK